MWEPHLLGGATGGSCEVPEGSPELLSGGGWLSLKCSRGEVELLQGETGTPGVTPAITNPGNLAPHSGNWFKRKIAEGSCQVLL